ncbi:TPA: substrate-binding domain-containing protein, partial [Enterococcus faecium]|nr:substrate-binding domain-containing protein [Enterococcus faecium]
LEVPFVKEINEKNEIIKTYLETHPNIDGVFAGDDLLASLAINNLGSSGKRVPKEVKVIGFDGAQQTLIYNPELSTIQQPIDQISKVAVKKLLNMIKGEKETDELSLPVKLIKKNTA